MCSPWRWDLLPTLLYHLQYSPTIILGLRKFTSSPIPYICASQTARLYDISANIPKVTFNLPAASLTCCFRSDEVGFAGGLDRVVHSLNLEKGSSSAIGIHTAPVSCLQWSPENNTLYSGNILSVLLYSSFPEMISRELGW
jgi:WD40 repeat protein